MPLRQVEGLFPSGVTREKKLALARELEYRGGSRVTQILKRLERTAQQEAGARQRLSELTRKAEMS